MKREVVSFVLTAALVVSGVTALENSPQIANWAPTVVAHADDSSPIVSQKTMDTWSWKLTADGILHISKGTQDAVLPESTDTTDRVEHPNWPATWQSPFQSIQQEENSADIKVISFDDKMKTPKNSAAMFKLFTINDNSNDYPQFRNWKNIDTSQTEDFSEMFSGSGQENIDVSHFDTSNATTMEGMFDGVTAKVVGYENFDTSKVTNFKNMFARFGDDPNGTIDVSHYQVSQVKGTDIDEYGDTVDLYNFDGMLGGVNAKSVNIGKWRPNAPLTGIFRASNSTSVTQLTLSPQDNLTDSNLLGPDTSNGTDLKKYTGNWENIKDQYVTGKKTTYKTSSLIAKYDGDSGDAGDETYIWEPVVTPGKPITVHYVDETGKTIQADQSVPGDLGTTYAITPQPITGYEYVKATDGSLTGTYTADPQSVTLVYKAKPTPPTTGTTTNNSAADSESTSSSESSSVESKPDQVTKTFPVAKRDRTVTGMKKLGLYKTPNFTKKSRLFYYGKQTRTKRPQFVIVGLAKSVNGTPRYLVKDVTQGSKRRGQTGYVTANQKFWVHSYYQTNPKTVKVLAKSGVNAYGKLSLSGKAKHYNRGQVLHIKRLVHYNLTTRLQLSNGRYVTANKSFIVKN